MDTALRDVVHLLARQDAGGDPTPPPTCVSSNQYDGRMGLRISAIFVIWFGSTLGACFPIFARRHKSLGVPETAFFIAKYFGSGIIIATAFIHLLAPAVEALGNECLTGAISSDNYPWALAIPLMTLFVMFIVELMVMRFANFDDHSHEGGHSSHGAADDVSLENRKAGESPASAHNHAPGDDHLGHSREHIDNASDWEERGIVPETYAAQMTAIFILEFGVVFHSVFIGLTLAVAGDEFITLYIVLVFHQTFEGLGLGSRLALVPWPKSKRWSAYVLGAAYGLSTPLATAIGLGVRNTFAPGSRTALITNGVFDAISAGILIYTGLVELMAHEFMFSPHMRKAPLKEVLSAVFLMGLGIALMSLLGKWA